MANHEHWLAVCRATLNGHHSKARKVWNSLSPTRRGILLHAAGMKSFFCRYAWDDFNQRELRQLKRGIQRLRAMVDMFGKFNELDFQVVAPDMPERRRPMGEVERRDSARARLESQADLLQRIAHVKH
ncbi:hypothetical protein [Serratia rhizosphaerae]